MQLENAGGRASLAARSRIRSRGCPRSHPRPLKGLARGPSLRESVFVPAAIPATERTPSLTALITAGRASALGSRVAARGAAAFFVRTSASASVRGQAPSGSGFVDRAESAGEGRVGRRPEGRRLPVHRAAGRDHEVGERDEALRVDRVLGHDGATAARAPERRPAARPCGAGRRPAPRRRRSRSSTRQTAGWRPGGRATPPAASARRRAPCRVERQSPAPPRRAGSRRGSTPPSVPG